MRKRGTVAIKTIVGIVGQNRVCDGHVAGVGIHSIQSVVGDCGVPNV